MNPFINKHCQRVSKEESSMNLSDIEKNRIHTPEWQFCATDNHLSRTFHFKNYTETMAFVNQVAEIADAEDHHPDMVVSYNRCKVCYLTHTVNGVTENDFICASRIDQIS